MSPCLRCDQTSKDKPFVFYPSMNPPWSPGLIGSGTDMFLSLLQREPEHPWRRRPGALRALCELG